MTDPKPQRCPADARAAVVRRLRDGAAQAPIWLSRSEARGLKEQAGDDWRAGAEMVEQMENLSRLEVRGAVDAVEAFAAAAPLEAPFERWLADAIALVEGRASKAGFYARRGVRFLVTLMTPSSP